MEDKNETIQDDLNEFTGEAESASTKISTAQELTEQTMPDYVNVFRRNDKEHPKKALFEKHRQWMSTKIREFPLPITPYRIGCYIRYHNQTKHNDYLYYHKKQLEDDIALCPRWTLVDFYVDKGSKAPRMENSPEWCRLLTDCFSKKINLIITQNLRYISSDPAEMTFIARMLAAQNPPIGIYIISENIFTLASYFAKDMRDCRLGTPLPNDELDMGMVEMEKKLPAGASSSTTGEVNG